MADKKISQLPAATTPLTGTEVLPIVQSSTTDQVSVANLTAGRAVSAASLSLTGSPLAIASGGTNQTAFTSPSSSIAGLVWFDGTSFQNDATPSHVGYNPSTNVFYANTPTFAGNTTLSTGNLIVGTSGKGTDFTASKSASATSNILAYYEEGPFTPVLNFGGATTGITYSTQTGKYTRIGNKIYIQASLILTSKGSATGNATITGLPFTASATVNLTPFSTWSTAMSFTGYIQPYVAASSSTLTLQANNGGAAANLADTSFTNTSRISISGYYEV